jgi:hypothetical protein
MAIAKQVIDLTGGATLSADTTATIPDAKNYKRITIEAVGSGVYSVQLQVRQTSSGLWCNKGSALPISADSGDINFHGVCEEAQIVATKSSGDLESLTAVLVDAHPVRW